MLNLSYILLGIATGVFSGFFGLGGGIILIPALTYLYGLSQHQSQGTSLAAMVPPITLLAAMRYYHSGNVKVLTALFIALGFVIGGFVGAHMVQYIEEALLKKVFGLVMLGFAIKMIFF